MQLNFIFAIDFDRLNVFTKSICNSKSLRTFVRIRSRMWFFFFLYYILLWVCYIVLNIPKRTSWHNLTNLIRYEKRYFVNKRTIIPSRFPVLFLLKRNTITLCITAKDTRVVTKVTLRETELFQLCHRLQDLLSQCPWSIRRL